MIVRLSPSGVRICMRRCNPMPLPHPGPKIGMRSTRVLIPRAPFDNPAALGCEGPPTLSLKDWTNFSSGPSANQRISLAPLAPLKTQMGMQMGTGRGMGMGMGKRLGAGVRDEGGLWQSSNRCGSEWGWAGLLWGGSRGGVHPGPQPHTWTHLHVHPHSRPIKEAFRGMD